MEVMREVAHGKQLAGARPTHKRPTEQGVHIMTWNKGISIAAFTLIAATLGAAETTVRYDTDHDRTLVADRDTDRSWCQYNANELSFDVFGTGSVGKNTLRSPSLNRIEDRGHWGAGVGVEYFFHRNLGIEAEAFSDDVDGNFVDNVNGNLIARFPLGTSGVAPYIFG